MMNVADIAGRKEARMDFEKIKGNLEKKGYKVRCFETKEEAAAYLNREIDGVSVGCGGSKSVEALGLADMLRTHNEFVWHWEGADRMDAIATDVYLSSVNGIAESGEIVNIDGLGNRLAGTLFGHKKLYYIIGKNKISEDLDSAIWRARNIASPLNAMRFGVKTPCALTGVCGDCNCADTICNYIVVTRRSKPPKKIKVILVGEEIGF